MVSIDEAKDFLFNCCKVPSNRLDSAGDLPFDSDSWRVGKYNGPPRYLKKFIPPKGWTAVGLKVSNLYDGGNNTWLGTSNSEGEWFTGYHGVKTSLAIHNICMEGFRKGPGQGHKDCDNINSINKNIYQKCGEGVYLAQDINQAAYYTAPIKYNNKNYKVVFMCRINPKAVKISNMGIGKDFYITSGHYDEVRPYRILFKS